MAEYGVDRLHLGLLLALEFVFLSFQEGYFKAQRTQECKEASWFLIPPPLLIKFVILEKSLLPSGSWLLHLY